MSTNLRCEVCGGNDYYTESGFYFCNECHAQSQQVVEEIVNPEEAFVHGRSRSVKSAASTSSQVSEFEGHEWTTWEAYNFILKGLVDELISAGAPSELKVVVLQLWARLLKKLSVAFLSKHRDRLPKLGSDYHDKDMYIVYGVSNKTKSKKVKKKKETSIDQHEASEGMATPVPSSVPVNRGVTKKALAKADYDSTFVDNMDDALSLLDHDSSVSSLIPLSTPKKSAVNRTNMFSAKAKEINRQMKQSKIKQHIDHKRRQRDPLYITRSRLLAIVYLGLRLVGSRIFLGDIMRWISEGVLSYYEVSHFFPTCSNLKALDGLLFGSFPRTFAHCTMREKTAELAKLLCVDTLTVPDILSLAARYIKELQLPDDVLTCVRKLFAIYTPYMKFDVAHSEVPNYEARAMAFIIIVLKLLFGLDGKTEHKISETATNFNTYLGSNKPTLFVWDDWRNYIVCRKAFISLFHFPTKDAVSQDSYEGIELYIEELKLLRQKDENGNKKIFMKNERMNPSVTSVLERPFEKLATWEPNHFSRITFTPSLTPYSSYLETINGVYKIGVDHKAPFPELLKQDFKTTEVKFLLDPDKFIKKAQRKGMKIKLCKSSAQENVKKVKVKGRKESNVSVKAFLPKESNSIGGSSSTEATHNSGLVGSPVSRKLCNGIAKQSSEDTECANSKVDRGVKYSFMEKKKKKRKRKHSDTNETSTTETSGYSSDVKKQRIKNGVCFRGKCKIGSKTVRERTSDQTNAAPLRDAEKCFRMYTPSSQYWFLSFPPKRFFSANMFISEVMPKFSASFQWLLMECASLIHTTEQDLYTEVVLMETLYGYVLNPDRCVENKRDNVSHFLKYVNTML